MSWMLPTVGIVVALVLALYQSKQGLFSAALHLVCVVCAGAIAFGLWEPIATQLLKTGFQNQAWGTALGATFAIALVVLRLASDKLVPENLNFSPTVNGIGGFGFGLAGSTITVGMLLISIGFLQSSDEFLYYKGWVRSQRERSLPADAASTPNPATLATAGLYDYVSAGSFRPLLGDTPMRAYYPDIERQAWSLHRDSANDGRAKTAVGPDSVDLVSAWYVPNVRLSLPSASQGAYAIKLRFDASAFDRGSAFTLSSAQARMIGGTGSRLGNPPVAHPVGYGLRTRRGNAGFVFDDNENYVVNIPAQQQVETVLLFPASSFGAPGGATAPRFVQVKGLRLAMPAVQVVNAAPEDALLAAALAGAAEDGATIGTGGQTITTGRGAPLPGSDIKVSNSIRPFFLSKNGATGVTLDDDNYIISGTLPSVPLGRGGVNISRALELKGFAEPEGTRIVQLRVARDAAIDIEQFKRDGRSDDALTIVDSAGNTYLPVGFIFRTKGNGGDGYFSIDKSRPLRSLDAFPPLPSSGVREIHVLYNVTIGAQLVEVRLGDDPVASLSVPVQAAR